MANPALIFLLFTVIHLTSAISVNIPQPSYEVALGDNAIIPCTFQTTITQIQAVTISWQVKTPNIDEQPFLTLYHYPMSPDSTDISELYAGRVSISLNTEKKQADLTLNAVTANDNKTFMCSVLIQGDIKGNSQDTAQLIVLVPPSVPNCNIQGKTEFFQNITMTCLSKDGIPTPTYKWQRYDGNNNPSPLPPKANDVNGLLSLYNLSADNSGYYICTAGNKIRSASCNVTLTVTSSTMNIASTAGIIGGCLAGLLLLIVVICCCCRRKKGEAEEYTMGSVKDGEFPDNEHDEVQQQEGKRIEVQSDRRDEYEERSDPQDDRGRGYNDVQGRLAPTDRSDDRRSDRYDDRQSDRYSDRYDDRRSERSEDHYENKRGDRYDERRDDRYGDRYGDGRSDRYDDQRSDRYNDSRDRYDDRRRDDRRRDDRRRDDR